MTLRFACRVWLVGRRNADGLCDVVFCQICRKEEFDFWFCLKKIFNGCIYALAPAPQAIDDLGKGVSQDEEKKPPGATQGSPYSDPNQDLADRLVEHELVEDLIGRGILEENGDGTMSIRLQ